MAKLERRPVVGRGWHLTVGVADLLLRWGLSPNGASMIGMFLGILGGWAFATTARYPGPTFWLLGAMGIFLRSAFNVLDGVMAHRSGNITPVGTFLNDITDRVADGAMLVGWGYAWGSSEVLGWASAFFALLTAAVRVTGKVAGARMHYGGIMSKPVRMYVLIFCALTMVVAPQPWLPTTALWLILGGSLITSFQRTLRILHDLQTPKTEP